MKEHRDIKSVIWPDMCHRSWSGISKHQSNPHRGGWTGPSLSARAGCCWPHGPLPCASALSRTDARDTPPQVKRSQQTLHLPLILQIKYMWDKNVITKLENIKTDRSSQIFYLSISLFLLKKKNGWRPNGQWVLKDHTNTNWQIRPQPKYPFNPIYFPNTRTQSPKYCK